MKVALLLSGGVDSSIAAHLLKEQGCQVIAYTMVNWDGTVADKAAKTARLLGIEHKVLDLHQTFQKKVVDYFCQTYAAGKTPNPCVRCNVDIKFGMLMDLILHEGFDRVATGHYARIEYQPASQRYCLKKGFDSSKDQSYFLYALSQEQLSRILFPLGDVSKDKVKEMAGEMGMKAAHERESQEICFIAEDYRDFLSSRISYAPGDVIDRQGKLMGRHRGLPFYTIGQRKGLGISAGRPVYVIGMDTASNRLVVDDEDYLYARELEAINNNFIYCDNPPSGLQVKARIRYRAADAPAVLYREKESVRLEFETAQRAITPGQSVVYYLDDYVLGGGIIN